MAQTDHDHEMAPRAAAGARPWGFMPSRVVPAPMVDVGEGAGAEQGLAGPWGPAGAGAPRGRRDGDRASWLHGGWPGTAGQGRVSHRETADRWGRATRLGGPSPRRGRHATPPGRRVTPCGGGRYPLGVRLSRQLPSASRTLRALCCSGPSPGTFAERRTDVRRARWAPGCVPTQADPRQCSTLVPAFPHTILSALVPAASRAGEGMSQARIPLPGTT